MKDYMEGALDAAKFLGKVALTYIFLQGFGDDLAYQLPHGYPVGAGIVRGCAAALTYLALYKPWKK
jgi:hypothetical protein